MLGFDLRHIKQSTAVRWGAGACLLLSVAACTGTIYRTTELGGHSVLSIDARQRVVVSRMVGEKHIFCAEPSPDAIVAQASYATAGLDPSIMGVGPIHASRKALEKAGWNVGDLDLVEANEAFAAQACAVNKDMGWNPDIVNVNGGAIAIGHPIGASGCRVLNTLLFEMKRRDAKKGLATLCIGGGMGVAMCVER